ncbi:MAG: 8-amino-7-oxononanoate synthase [Deltaproteobacteria bacterium]|nr:8-amino-7-oxononanoate synthase [Deltaproteobacteria bacterium]
MNHGQMKEELVRLHSEGLLRRPVSFDLINGKEAVLKGRKVVIFSSNNYLDLAGHPAVVEAGVIAMRKYGAGGGASRLVSGTFPVHEELEHTIRLFKKTESALLFNSGYHANIGVIPALVGRGDDVFSDRLNHGSILDGCILSRANIRRYPHCDMSALERLIKNSRSRRRLIITEGVFSMEGRVAPLREITWLSQRYGALVYLDDAHAVGVMGKEGRGALEHLGIENDSVIEMATLGKAFGSYGAFVAGGKPLIDLLMNKARSFIYTTSLPPAVCAVSMKAIEAASLEPWRRKAVIDNSVYLMRRLKDEGFDVMQTHTHIVPLFIGGAKKVMDISARLIDRGFFIQGIRPPTVPNGTSRLRITVTAGHTKEDIDGVVIALKDIIGDTT